MIKRLVRFVDERSAGLPVIKKTLRYLFPDHWSFLLGEVALYCFMILVATGTYLALFFHPDREQVYYHGAYRPLQGLEMSDAYKSAVDLSLNVKAGLLLRQTHHWAADVFVAAIVLHLLRIFFTGAYRKPRGLTYVLGVAMLGATLLEGYLGYSMIDDLLSGMGLAIGYSVAMSIPFVGANIANLIWGAPFPGDASFWPRMYIAHVFLLPALIAVLLGGHLLLVAARHHTQFRRPRRTEKKVVGVPTFPGQTPRSLGLLLATAAVLFLLGGLVQINPIWQWGPYHTYSATNGAQPDWYLGWLIGALRLVPNFDWVVGRYTLVPNPFWGGALFPVLVFGFLALYPVLERRFTGDQQFHNLLDRPRDAPWRTALGVAFFTWIFLVFLAGASDRVFIFLGVSYVSQIWVYRVAVFVAPLVALAVTRRICGELQQKELIELDRKRAETGRPVSALEELGREPVR